MPLQTRGYILVIVIVLCVIGVIIYVAAQPRTPRTSATSGIVECKINSAIGIDKVTITNLNTGKTTIRSLIDLPFSFNCTEGDYLRISVTTLEGYTWDSWWFDRTGRFDNYNPMTVAIKSDLILTPKCIISEVAPTPNPSPSSYPSPSPTSTPTE